MEFAETDAGWINLSHVRSIVLTNALAAVPSRAVFLDIEGRPLGTSMRAWEVDRAELAGKLVPASADTTAVLLTVALSPYRPVLGDLVVQVVPVIAWRIDRRAEPVLLDPVAVNQRVLVMMPDGELKDAETEYASIDAAKQALLHDAQLAWDHRHADAIVQGEMP